MDAQAPAIMAALAILALAGLAVGIQAWRATSKVNRRWRALLADSDVETLGSMLQAHLEERRQLQSDLQDAEARIRRLEEQMKSAKRYLGFRRYDAFPELSGRQSFSLALYDEEGDGVVITSQVGRESIRVFAKSLQGGEGDRDLTAEEMESLQAGARPSGERRSR
jgi:hypothetical protein